MTGNAGTNGVGGKRKILLTIGMPYNKFTSLSEYSSSIFEALLAWLNQTWNLVLIFCVQRSSDVEALKAHVTALEVELDIQSRELRRSHEENQTNRNALKTAQSVIMNSEFGSMFSLNTQLALEAPHPQRSESPTSS